jgi:predicted GNAT family N-acyltransferase
MLCPAYDVILYGRLSLDMLVKAAKDQGVTAISLEATDMGRPLYEKYGFVKMNDEMELLN